MAIEPEPLRNVEPPRSGGRAEHGGRAASLDELSELDRIPLRLKVSRGGLGIELCESLKLGPLLLEAYEWALADLAYPLDLSGGVKEFVDRQGTLERVKLTFQLSELRPWVVAAAEPIFGTKTDCRIRARDVEGEVEIAVSIWSDTQALAFDLVLGSTLEPQLVLDQIRGFGLATSPLEVALGLLDSLCTRALGPAGILRRGRALPLGAAVEALSLELLPALGCRLPDLGPAVVSSFALSRGDVSLTLAVGEESMRLGRRGLRLGGLVDALRNVDDLVASGRRDEARRELLGALEEAPGSVEMLLDLARLDFLESGHAETARSYLEEARERQEGVHGPGQVPQVSEALVLAFEADLAVRTHHETAARECLRRAAELEPDPSLSAFHFFSAATLGLSPQAFDLELLECSLERAPHLVLGRWAHVEGLLAQRSLDRLGVETAARDVERLFALSSSSDERVAWLLKASHSFAASGVTDLALEFSRRALSLDPRHPEVLVLRAELLLGTGEPERAIELLRAALGTLRNRAAALVFSSSDQELIGRASVLLAEARVEVGSDYSEAIRLVASVDSRSPHGLKARRLECEYALRLGDERARLRAVEKLLEAAELGWIPGAAQDRSGAIDLLERLAREEAENGPAGVSSRLRALAGELSA